MFNQDAGVREPLTACRRKDNPKLCKADFPRTKWLWHCAVVLCQGLAKQMDMAITGRRSKLGSLHGPMNDEYLNATHPAMLSMHRFNSDVQLPYRFPIMCMTCSCGLNCGDGVADDVIIRAAQVAQDAQSVQTADELGTCSQQQQQPQQRQRTHTTAGPISAAQRRSAVGTAPGRSSDALMVVIAP